MPVRHCTSNMEMEWKDLNVLGLGMKGWGTWEGGREGRMRDMVYILLWYSFWWYLYPVPESSKQLMYSCYDHAIYWVRHTPTQTWRGYSRYNNVTHPSTLHFSSIQLTRKQSSHCIDIEYVSTAVSSPNYCHYDVSNSFPAIFCYEHNTLCLSHSSVI